MTKKKVKKRIKIKKSKKKESRKENVIEDSEPEEKIDISEQQRKDTQFTEFFQPDIEGSIETTGIVFSPVLERVEVSEQDMSLEQNISTEPINRREESVDENIVTYNEPDYIAEEQRLRERSEDLIVKRGAERVIPRSGVVDISPDREMGFRMHEGLWAMRNMQEDEIEKDYVVKAGELEREEKLPFEEHERNYKGRKL